MALRSVVTLGLISSVLVDLINGESTATQIDSDTLDDFAITDQIGVLSEQIYLKIRQNNTDNFVFSPLSLHSALTLLFLGATPGSNTEEELGKTLSSVINRAVFLDFYSNVTDHYKTTNFAYGNKVLINKAITVNPNYKEYAARLDTHIDSVDFNQPETVTALNTWVSNLTNGQINQLTDSLEADTQMLLVNAIYLNEEWTRHFTVLKRKMKFITLQEELVDVEMMERTDSDFSYGRFKFGDDIHTHEIITIPYKSPDFEMQLIIPSNKNKMGLLDIEDALERQDRCHIIQLTGSCKGYFKLFIEAKDKATHAAKDIRLTMPLFDIQSTIDAGKILKELGATAMFTERGGLTKLAESQDLKVSNILQKAIISVDSEGTEAAAATSVEIVPFSAEPSNLLKIFIDRPFIYVLWDKHNNIPVIMGRVTDPRS